MKTRIEDCPHCEATGDQYRHIPSFYDPYYMSRQHGVPCEHCDGKGNVEVEIEDEAEDA